MVKEEKTMEEKLARQNKLLNLINFKKSVQEKVIKIIKLIINNIQYLLIFKNNKNFIKQKKI